MVIFSSTFSISLFIQSFIVLLFFVHFHDFIELMIILNIIYLYNFLSIPTITFQWFQILWSLRSCSSSSLFLTQLHFGYSLAVSQFLSKFFKTSIKIQLFQSQFDVMVPLSKNLSISYDSNLIKKLTLGGTVSSLQFRKFLRCTNNSSNTSKARNIILLIISVRGVNHWKKSRTPSE